MNFILFISAIILVFTFSMFGIVFTLIKSILTLNYSYLNRYFLDISISLDQLGNVVMRSFLNFSLIKASSKNKFGNPDETISSVLGKNQKNSSLIYLGKRLIAFLDWLDEDHSIKSIEN